MLKNLNKGISTPLAIGIIIVAAILVGGIFYWQWLGSEEVEAPAEEGPEEEILPPALPGEEQAGQLSQQENKIDTSDWKTYRNEEYGFEVKYPRNWSFIESFIPSSYHLGEWVVIGQPVVSFEISEIEYQKTNLNIAFLAVAIGDDKEVQLQCLRRRFSQPITGGEQAGEKLTKEIDINGVIFYKEYYMIGGMSKYGSAKSYRTIYKNQCYELVTVMEASDMDVLSSSVSEFNEENLLTILNQILFTFRFLE